MGTYTDRTTDGVCQYGAASASASSFCRPPHAREGGQQVRSPQWASRLSTTPWESLGREPVRPTPPPVEKLFDFSARFSAQPRAASCKCSRSPCTMAAVPVAGDADNINKQARKMRTTGSTAQLPCQLGQLNTSKRGKWLLTLGHSGGCPCRLVPRTGRPSSSTLHVRIM